MVAAHRAYHPRALPPSPRRGAQMRADVAHDQLGLVICAQHGDRNVEATSETQLKYREDQSCYATKLRQRGRWAQIELHVGGVNFGA